jgi:5'(3')-deoxyribonucleotidase
MKPDFLIDVDEVLADFVSPAMVLISEVLGRPWGLADAPLDQWDMFAALTQEEKAAVFSRLNDQGFCASLKPTLGSQDFVEELHQHCDVYAVTAPHHGSFYWVPERNEWLGDIFGIDRKHIIHTDAKYMCKGAYFLDDNPQHVLRWKQRHHDGRGMLWSTTHNQRLKGHEDIRVHSWEEVLNQLAR